MQLSASQRRMSCVVAMHSVLLIQPITLDSGIRRFMRIFAGVPNGKGVSNSRVIENVDFRAPGRYVFGTLGNEGNSII